MRTPEFWQNPPERPGWKAHLLAPLGALYALGTARRLARGGHQQVGVPVVCVGNINAGGTGKTPTVIAIVDYLRGLFHEPHVVSRGYGGKAEGPLRVVPGKHSAAMVGDEPLLLAAFAETWVAKDRVAGAQAAAAAGASVIVLDDGFQDPALHHDVSVVVVDAARGFGNQRCVPAGPLREPVQVGLARADLVISIGAEADQHRFATQQGELPVPHVQAELTPLQTGMDWSGTPVFAFAGIGHPEKFFATLRALGANIVHAEALADHQPLTAAMLSRLERDAAQHGAQLVTTEKDAARMPPGHLHKIMSLPVRLSMEQPNPLTQTLDALPRPE